MSARAELRRFAIFVAVLAAVDVLGAYALDAASITDVVVAPTSWRTALALAPTLVFYAARIALFFAAPGLLVGGAIVALTSPRDEGS